MVAPVNPIITQTHFSIVHKVRNLEVGKSKVSEVSRGQEKVARAMPEASGEATNEDPANTHFRS